MRRAVAVGALLAVAAWAPAAHAADYRDGPVRAHISPTRNRDLLDGVVYSLLDGPLNRGWTALQAWDPRAGEGAMLAFRQGSDDPARTIALRNVPAGHSFALYEGAGETPVGTFTAAELSRGLRIEIPEAEGSRALLLKALR